MPNPKNVSDESGSSLAALFEADEELLEKERAKAPKPKQLSDSEVSAILRSSARKRAEKRGGRYNFAVVVTKVPGPNTKGTPYEAVVPRGAYDEFEGATSETEAIRMFIDKYKLDPFGQGYTSHYSFKAVWVPAKKGEEDPRPRPPYTNVEAQEKIARYQEARGKQVLVGIRDSEGNVKAT